jgi:hypothetical protein
MAPNEHSLSVVIDEVHAIVVRADHLLASAFSLFPVVATMGLRRRKETSGIFTQSHPEDLTPEAGEVMRALAASLIDRLLHLEPLEFGFQHLLFLPLQGLQLGNPLSLDLCWLANRRLASVVCRDLPQKLLALAPAISPVAAEFLRGLPAYLAILARADAGDVVAGVMEITCALAEWACLVFLATVGSVGEGEALALDGGEFVFAAMVDRAAEWRVLVQ